MRPATAATAKKEEEEASGSLCKKKPLEEVKGHDDSNVDTEEWSVFLDSQQEDILSDVDALNNQNYISMLAAPLRNARTEPYIIEKICQTLSMPFAMGEEVGEETLAALVRGYAAVAVIESLVAAMKHLERDSPTLSTFLSS
jgi:hypothetical protein